jgi:hypothetical protein
MQHRIISGPDEWQIQTLKLYQHTSPGLIRPSRIVAPGVTERAQR